MIVAKEQCVLCELAGQTDPEEPHQALAMAVVIGVSVGDSDEADIGLCTDCQTILDLAVESHNQADIGPGEVPQGGASEASGGES